MADVARMLGAFDGHTATADETGGSAMAGRATSTRGGLTEDISVVAHPANPITPTINHLHNFMARKISSFPLPNQVLIVFLLFFGPSQECFSEDLGCYSSPFAYSAKPALSRCRIWSFPENLGSCRN